MSSWGWLKTSKCTAKGLADASGTSTKRSGQPSSKDDSPFRTSGTDMPDMYSLPATCDRPATSAPRQMHQRLPESQGPAAPQISPASLQRHAPFAEMAI